MRAHKWLKESERRGKFCEGETGKSLSGCISDRNMFDSLSAERKEKGKEKKSQNLIKEKKKLTS